ncbi:ABC transporter permease [Williamsia phyllosphaerae]|uniref:ABC transporter membrane-spanning protein n=1 Tax=Williamsia phyllosphaerae TaxID=885042 RepID=A0ABQ1V357_9NOCA|nr:hypothetical protein [Williamsia phyllosphaerae]GGF36177.1 ABC transporter membrane-spanning protein [Williamsia phyllosphaerae]
MTGTDLAAGAGLLTRLAVRRERFTTPLGMLALPVLVVVTGASMASLYASPGDRAELRSGAASNVAFRLLLGPLGSDTTIASITTWRVGLFLLLVAGVLASLLITRNTRAQEESGLLEIVRSGAVGAATPLLVAVAIASTAGVATGCVMAIATAAIGAPGVAAVAVGVQYCVVSLAVIGVAAMVNQLAATARTATATAVSVLVGGYLLRGVADVVDGAGWLRWVSPLGWGELIDPFGRRDPVPVVLCVALFAASVVGAAMIAVRRDLGEGIRSRREGPAGSTRLGSVGALMARVSGPAIVPWVSAVVVYCLLLGFLLSSVGDLVPDGGGVADVVRDLGGGGGLARSVMTAVLGFVGVIAGLAAVAVVVRTRGDEAAGRTEQVLATATSRTRWFASMAAAVFGTSVLVVVGATLAIVVGHGISSGVSTSPTAGDVLAAGAVQIPGSIAVAAVAVAAYGWGSRWVPLGWVAVVGDAVLAQFGDLLGLPMWVRDIAPHAHVVATAPDAVGVWTPVLTLGGAAALVAFGWWGFRRRDIPG